MAYTDIDNPSETAFNTVLYTGNGGNGHTISGVGFQSDLTWLKSRSSAISHMWIDSVRGVNTVINSNTTDAETTFNCLDPWNSDGFVLSNNTNFNGNGVTFAAWNWKAGTSFTNDASSTGIGTIDSAGSRNTDAGFSIISWTGDGNNGATIAHGLGVTPAIVITKRRSAVGDWLVGGSLIDTVRGGANSLLLLNTTAAMDSNSEVYQTFSSTTFQVGVNAYANTSGSTMISYCFADVKGYSKFGSYVGNGNADGTFTYTGFKPAFLIQKRTDTGGYNWQMHDNKRSSSGGGNILNSRIAPNSSNAEETDTIGYDFLSNGFKVFTTNANYNASGGTYIYMAFAENPFVTSTGVPATAR